MNLTGVAVPQICSNSHKTKILANTKM